MRNVSRSKFLLCFRPVVDIDDMLKSKVANKHEMKKSSDTQSEFFDQVSTKISESWIMQQHPPKRTISRVIKAVVFQTMLKTKIRRKNRYPNDSFGSKHTYDSEDSQSVLSSSSSNSSVSSCSSPTESKSLAKYPSTKDKQKESNYGKKQKQFECNGIYLILISLAFTVFLGKIFGIIMTLMWLYLFSLLSSSYGYKKKLPRCLEAKDKGQFGRSARRELLLYHNNGH